MRNEDVQRVEFRHPDGMGSLVEVVDLAELRLRPRKVSPPIDRPTQLNFHCAQWVVRGKGAHWVDYQKVPVRAGDLLHIRPAQVHAFDRESTHEARLLVFLPEAIPETLSLRLTHPLKPSPIRPTRSEAKHIGQLAELMLSAQKTRTVLGEQQPLRHMLAAVLSAAQAIAERNAASLARGRASDTSHEFDALIDGHLYEQKDLTWYAGELEVSARTLTRACLEAFEMSAKQHLDGRVALEAKRLLVHTNDTVQAVGARLGFVEATNFVKFFRRVEGLTPLSFRNRVRAFER
ncbi:MAG: AraC family transcriptional regulator [Candidatus Eisenbacteria bacterium]|uniref:AraC family transcriptional regulator n=1 Tax=Eiseniibacteriota bacterium TaxID=2212470 RepID=A0A7Y2H115_UNCEI|nr:AraC family transcriptional regulator [Candidatus Eisenbacteria bacterium]